VPSPPAPLRVGLVLGAGGTPGYDLDTAALLALEAATGWDARTATVVVGTSAGSLVGARLRAGLTPTDVATRASEGAPLPAARPAPVDGARRAPVLADGPARVGRWFLRARAAGGRQIARRAAPGLQSNRHLGEPLTALHGATWPAAPLWLCAVDARTAERVVIGSGRPDAPTVDVATAARASAAVPGYYAPVEVDGRALIDGAVRSTTNADLLLGLGDAPVPGGPLDVVIAVAPMAGAPGAAGRSRPAVLRAVHRWTVDAELRLLAPAGVRVLRIVPGAAALARYPGYDDLRGAARATAIGALRDDVTAALARPPAADVLAVLRAAAAAHHA
jgi:NTE family protein